MNIDKQQKNVSLWRHSMGPRTETTEYLAECIVDALIESMKQTSIERVKIQDITD